MRSVNKEWMKSLGVKNKQLTVCVTFIGKGGTSSNSAWVLSGPSSSYECSCICLGSYKAADFVSIPQVYHIVLFISFCVLYIVNYDVPLKVCVIMPPVDALLNQQMFLEDNLDISIIYLHSEFCSLLPTLSLQLITSLCNPKPKYLKWLSKEITLHLGKQQSMGR